MKKLLKILFITYVFIFNFVSADVPSNQAEEVTHLIAYVENSACIIKRNGSDYPAEKSVSHIEMKYDYFRDDIKSSEEFIEYSATKSTMSGKYYTVTCPGKQPMKTQDWLLTELNRFRMEKK